MPSSAQEQDNEPELEGQGKAADSHEAVSVPVVSLQNAIQEVEAAQKRVPARELRNALRILQGYLPKKV